VPQWFAHDDRGVELLQLGTSTGHTHGTLRRGVDVVLALVIVHVDSMWRMADITALACG